MDVVALLDKLEGLVGSSSRIPLTGKIVVDEESIYAIIDDIRSSMPEELKQAKLVVRERERLIEEAKREAEETLAEAETKAARLAQESYLVEEAKKQALEITDKARAISQEIVEGAKRYADDVLALLVANLEKFLAAVQAGRDELRKGRSPGTPGTEAALTKDV